MEILDKLAALDKLLFAPNINAKVFSDLIIFDRPAKNKLLYSLYSSLKF